MTQIGSSIRRTWSDCRRFRGFTLIELLVVVAIIGIIAAILIPNLLDAIQKAKQRRAMTDMQLTGTAWMSWLTDLDGAAAAGRGNTAKTIPWSSSFDLLDHADLNDTLVPQYANDIPVDDPWSHPYEFRLAASPGATALPFGMRASGADGAFDGDTYIQGAFIGTDYAQDIVWAAGYFVRWPGGVGPSGSPP